MSISRDFVDAAAKGFAELRALLAVVEARHFEALEDRGLSAIEAALAGLRSLAERQRVLARDNGDALLQGEIDEIVASMRAAGADDGVRDPAAYLAGLKVKIEAARAAVKLTTTARSAVKRYSEELQKQADDFSARVLDPLNTVIDDFNEAMLSTPGESIQFKADTRVDATSFGMALRYREKVDNAIETKKDLPPSRAERGPACGEWL